MDFAALQPIVQLAAQEIVARDPDVHTVGITKWRGQPVLRAVRRATLRAQSTTLPRSVEGLPLRVEEAMHPLVPLYKIPGAEAQASSLPEQEQQRPLTLGLQVQNIDNDLRGGAAGSGYRTVGTLGCFVLKGNTVQMLSNNHVLAGENDAQLGDRIQQPGALEAAAEQMVAELSAFVPLTFTPEGQLGMDEGVNLVDAATAKLTAGIGYVRAYLSHHPVSAPSTVREPRLGERVYKVGRTTGLTRGQVSAVLVEAGPVGYDAGEAYFRRSFAVRGLMGTLFSSGGDSGSAIVAAQDDALLGLLYAGNGVETYACLATEALSALEATLS
jgi:hypothetical protein